MIHTIEITAIWITILSAICDVGLVLGSKNYKLSYTIILFNMNTTTVIWFIYLMMELSNQLTVN